MGEHRPSPEPTLPAGFFPGVEDDAPVRTLLLDLAAEVSSELEAADEFDVVVVNDDVARAADELVGLLTAPSPGLVPGE